MAITTVDTVIFENALLFSQWVIINNRPYAIKRGTWNFYLPSLNLKLPYVCGGKIACRAKSSPNRSKLFSGNLDDAQIGRYTPQEWKDALSKTSRLRAVENYITGKRLESAGLGPAFSAIVIIRNLYSITGANFGECAGVKCDNVYAMPSKEPASQQDIRNAGIKLDKFKSSHRQQIRGYVCDLNSVVGVMPKDAEDEINMILNSLPS